MATSSSARRMPGMLFRSCTSSCRNKNCPGQHERISVKHRPADFGQGWQHHRAPAGCLGCFFDPVRAPAETKIAPASTKEFLSNTGLLILGKDGNIIERPQDAWDAFSILYELLPKQKLPQPARKNFFQTPAC